MRTYANRYAAAAGKSVAAFTNNNSGQRTAQHLRAHGIHVEAVNPIPGNQAMSS